MQAIAAEKSRPANFSAPGKSIQVDDVSLLRSGDPQHGHVIDGRKR
jgi:hypothetical protein